ncbi:Eukaryotic translation initiation factor 3 subunit M [Quillaja saponaria]|uniref:Eukaryotic translation initiation factor 3 subunit M n=1 Tax=Quillaja saponaria TaxID=32244 RepID=A0AAD7PXM8_QUISA|nr:Eukaryotic translation initiation factor 3 subunit M [Quillaja saponaria]
MLSVVPTSEEDPALASVRFASELAWADAGAEAAEPEVTRLCMEAEEFIAMGKWVELATLMVTSAELIFSKVSEKDVECIFTIICSLVMKTENADEVSEITKIIAAKIIQQPHEKPAVRLKMLFNLYNSLQNPYGRFFIYMKALSLAVNRKVAEYIIPSFKHIDGFLKEWDVGIEEQRELFLAISNILKENKSLAKNSFKRLCAIIEFVKSPDMYECDLLDMPAIRQLEKDSKDALVYQLLNIFLTQRLDSYLEFHAANSTLLNSYGLVHEECITKLRLMSLVDLGSDRSSQIPYALIRDTLLICFIVLNAFRANVANVISTIQANKITEDGFQGCKA